MIRPKTYIQYWPLAAHPFDQGEDRLPAGAMRFHLTAPYNTHSYWRLSSLELRITCRRDRLIWFAVRLQPKSYYPTEAMQAARTGATIASRLPEAGAFSMPGEELATILERLAKAGITHAFPCYEAGQLQYARPLQTLTAFHQYVFDAVEAARKEVPACGSSVY